MEKLYTRFYINYWRRKKSSTRLINNYNLLKYNKNWLYVCKLLAQQIHSLLFQLKTIEINNKTVKSCKYRYMFINIYFPIL